MEKIKQLTSDNLVDSNIEALKQLFPTAFSEGKVVMEELQALLGDYVEKDKEYYEFNWAGKHLARQEANKVSTGTLRPCKEESKNWDDTQNLYIEGDNLEVLKLMQKTYSNKVKMIYIDPPYNTGKDFVYKDNYKDNLNNYLEISGQLDEDGKKLSTNTESDGRYHSNWLNMMYPRLRLARNLLTDDGVIFISIDDNEQANLKKLCDEVFGEENCCGIISRVMKSGGAKGRFFSPNVEYILVYSKNNEQVGNFREGISEDIINKLYTSVESDGIRKGEKYRPFGLYQSSLDARPNQRYYIECPDGTLVIPPGETMPAISKDGEKVLPNSTDGCWRWSQERYLEEKEKGNIDFKRSNGVLIDSEGNPAIWNIYTKIWLLDREEEGMVPVNLITKWENRHGTKEVSLMNIPFDFSKPSELIKYLISILYIDKSSIILDFFSGSSTTAHAVMALNAEDGGSRRCISVQLPEPTEEKSEAYKAGYSTIAEIGKERIRRAGAKIAEEIDAKIKELEDKTDKLSKELPTDETKGEIANLKAEIQNLKNQDLGFRVFKLDSSNIKRWDTAPESLEQQLDMFDEAIKSDRTEEDILYEILLKYGLDLTTPIAEKVVDGCTIYNVGFGSLYVCLSENIQPTVAQAIADWHKEFEDTNPNVIFSDSGFNGNDAAKTNAVQSLRQMGIENVRSI